MSAGRSRVGGASSRSPVDPVYARKWKAFWAISISFFTMVMSMSMVFIALESIADDFGVTLRAVSWVVIAQALTISALMMPMGRMADIIGRKKVHLIGLVFFAGGAIFTALAPAFGLLILSRVVMAIGNAMSQSVGTAMVISVFPPQERGKAIGSQTTAVALGGAVGPVIAGVMLQFFAWQSLFWMLVPPIVIAFVVGYIILDEEVVSQRDTTDRPQFDWIGAILSGMAIVLAVIVINNPLAESWTSPFMIGGVFGVAVLLTGFVAWELRSTAPMLQLRMFSNRVFTMAVLTRFLGFLGTTAVRFLMPIYLISFRGIEEIAAGAILLFTSLGMAIAAQSAGRLSDRFGERPFTVAGFVVLVGTAVGFVMTTETTPLWLVTTVLFVNGLAMGLWNVPNNSTIMGSVPRSSFGVIGAFTNLTRNVGNVTGQAVASAIVVGVMASRGFDIPLS
ncbi:MAG: MFS transporter, partial [Chloroflexi bacterium]|nr:MFS transporter [Chloroflexota bacterium]